MDLSRWNKAIHHIVPNRGRVNTGDDVLREMGFAIVQMGWQGDLTATETNIVPFLPIAKHSNRNMVAGIRHPNLVAPIGTFTGWNLRREGFAEGEQCAGAGSYIPFAADMRERQASGDPRLSIAERYPTHDAYVSAVAQAADRLVQDRLLLQRDADAIVESAEGSKIGKSP